MWSTWKDQGVAGRDTLAAASRMCANLWDTHDPQRPHLRWRGQVIFPSMGQPRYVVRVQYATYEPFDDRDSLYYGHA